jgi:transposase
MDKRKTKTYPLEFKKSSAQLAATSDQPITQTAKDLGVNSVTLHGWVKQYCPKPFTKKPQENNLIEEVARLRKEVTHLKQERDILKKAAAYFASETS